MSENCNVLKNDLKDMPVQLRAYLRSKDIKAFINSFLDDSELKQRRFIKTALDPTDLVQALIQLFMKNFDLCILELTLSPKGSRFISDLDRLRTAVEGKLFLQSDKTLSGSTNSPDADMDDNEDVKTASEILDLNRAKLNDHLKEIYGTGAYNIISHLKEVFGDAVTSIGYWNSKTGELAIKNNEVLNLNIQNYKNKLYSTLVKYLKSVDSTKFGSLAESMTENDKFIGPEFYGTLNEFYKYIKGIENFSDRLTADNKTRIELVTSASKSLLYSRMMEVLNLNAKFDAAMERAYGKTLRRKTANTSLYVADDFSPYYYKAKELIKRNKLEDLKVGEYTVQEVLDQLESTELTLLEAVNAYTQLTHFDELLKEIHGDSFSIKKGMEGVEIADMNKYTYHQDTAHEKKSWQQGESVDSEKYTSNLTKQVFNLVKIFNYKTDQYTNRRLDATKFIVASHNLLDDIVYDRVSFNIGRGTKDKPNPRYTAVEAFKNASKNLHSNPTRNLQKMLELLFDLVPENRNRALIDDISLKRTGIKRLTTDDDLNVLYSIYHQIFNKNNDHSLYSLEMKLKKGINGAAQSLMGEIAGYVDRNASIHYLETSYDRDTGEVRSVVKRKFSNGVALSRMLKLINQDVNGVSLNRAKQLLDAYEFEIEPDSLSTRRRYSVNINGNKFTLSTDAVGVQIFNGKNQSLSQESGVTGEDSILKRIRDNVDIVSFREKILDNASLNEDEQNLKDILQFIDDYLGLKFLGNAGFNLQVLDVFKSIYNGDDLDGVTGQFFLEPLMKLAMRAAYAVNKIHLANESGKTLKQYLDDLESDDGIYKTYKENSNTNKTFSEKFGDVKYRIVSRTDEVLSLLADARAMLTGEASRATTKDKAGNNIPNNSVNKMGNILPHYLNKLAVAESNVSDLLFVENPNLIRSVYHDLEVTSWNGESKQVKSFTAGELFYHGIFNKFWGNYLNNGTVVVLPTTYSDKTTFLNWALDTKLDGENDILSPTSNYKKMAIQYYMDTIGRMYSKVWETTENKLQAIADAYNADQRANNPAWVDLNYRQVLHNLNEAGINKYAALANVDVELDKDYRLVKNKDGKKVGAINELLHYYGTELYQDEKLLDEALTAQKEVFVSNLLQANSSFQVIDYNDEIENYYEDDATKGVSKNAIIKSILKYYKDDVEGRKTFFKDWVDADTGKLIIAKQSGRKIIGIGNNFKPGETVVLNPFLDKFFYVEGLMSNNLRMSLTGSEINHPDKASNTSYNQAKKFSFDVNENNNESKVAKNLENFNKMLKTDLDISEAKLVLAALKTTMNVSDLDSSFMSRYSGRILDALNKVRNSSLLAIANTAQGTQFKRNVIIPATLQYCRQNYIDGVSAKIKCAVIRDEAAHVWNYRGDRDGDIDAADGSALINPFQSILENKSLDSQAVGFIKKPIWHSYDVESGTAYLAKFATDTITNEVMRTSVASTSSLYRMFRKMTNMQWGADVDLLESITLGKMDPTSVEVSQWFNTQILGNPQVDGKPIRSNRLIYKNEYGENVEIIGLNKTVTKEGLKLYYTEETAFSKNPVDNPKVNKVYHVFEGPTSRHLTFDTYQKAESYVKQHEGAHTINSLFELHAALGGINCVNSKGAGSEFNNEVVVNFMNAVGRVRPGKEHESIIDQETYYQPLKDYHIGYALNNSAVKNGAKNINQASAWSDDSELSWFEADSDGLGMQMNADHDIIDSELTEFSQVVTATSAYGYTHDQCNEIFEGLARAAVQASKKALDAVDKFLQENFEEGDRTKAQSDLYDAIGRIILVNQSIKDKESLQGVIMEAVTNVFYKSKDHSKDSYKIPFSDANVYSDFISTLASTINKNSIKRKHPGSGCVMVPGYNTVQYFEVDGKKLFADDVLKAAREDYKQELMTLLSGVEGYDAENNRVVVGEKTYLFNNLSLRTLESYLKELKLDNTSAYYTEEGDVTAKNQNFITRYLLKKQAQVATLTDKSYYMPSDIVNIVDDEGKILTTVNMDSLDTYYKFKDGVYDAQLEHNVSIKVDYEKGRYDIALNEDPSQSFRIEKDENNPEMFNIHFRTGKMDEATGRRVLGNTPLTTEQKNRLFLATLLVLPLGSKVRISPTTEQQIKSGKGGLNKGSIIGWNSMLTNADRFGNTILERGASYEVLAWDSTLGAFVPMMVSEFTKTYQAPKYKYQDSIVDAFGKPTPHNLRPSLIRWKYLGLDGAEHYANVFDSKVIRESFTKPYNLDDNYRTLIQDVLHSINEGIDPDHGNIIEGTLENTAAELVMSNLYQDKFGTDNITLNEVLEKGEKYFRERKLNVPNNLNYDIAFLSDQGSHTLITFRNVTTNESVYEQQFDPNQLYTNEKDEIILMQGNRELFEVGRWTSDNSVIFRDGKFFKDGVVVSNQNDYRIKDVNNPQSVQRKIMYVTLYKVLDLVDHKGTIKYKTNTLYKIASLKDFLEAMKDLPKRNSIEEDASNLRASIIQKMFGNNKAIYINGAKAWASNKLIEVEKALSRIKSNNYVSKDIKDLLNTLLSYLHSTTTSYNANESEDERKARIELQRINRDANFKAWNQAQKDFLDKEAHRKWISFLDSLNFIASRIPAQTLQSFMSMKLIGWTGNSKNMAYVSHFQTYLQGSDYDIDKAYIMGQSYNDASTYIGWSNLFDFSTYNTLQASKSLPVPKKMEITLDTTVNDDNIDMLFAFTDGTMQGLESEQLRILALKLLGSIIKRAERNGGKLQYSGTLMDKIDNLLKLIQSHEFTPLHPSIAEAAYKNIASANIYAVAHDIRNRDLAYTAISMDILKRAAGNSPKGNQAGALNMLNPLTKYVMQYQNLVGKNVISIAANGEKVWFNAFYHWHQVLKNGSIQDVARLKFSLTFNRILNRANHLVDNSIPIESRTITHLPDLNARDQYIKDRLISEFGATDQTLDYKYVDQLISLLLSAATDNAKELILAKINSGTNFARMYVYAMMSGYNIDDIVAFMTSPVAEFIDLMSAANMFLNTDTNNNATSAINLAFGKIRYKDFLHGQVSFKNVDPESGLEVWEQEAKDKSVLADLNNLPLELLSAMQEYAGFTEDENGHIQSFTNLSDAMEALINVGIRKKDIDIRNIIQYNDIEIQTYAAYCQDILDKLRSVYSSYTNPTEASADIQEFRKLYHLATEVSTVASAWLGLNQGLPTSELDILKRLFSMSKIVSKREQALGIVDRNMYPKSVAPDIEEDEEWEQSVKVYKGKSEKVLANNKQRTLQTIKENNPTLSDDDILIRLDEAHENGLINNFDVVKYLTDENGYRQKIKNYYGLLMGTLNVFDMMDTIPHYRTIIDCFKTLVTSNNLAAKSRYINSLLKGKTNVTDSELSGAIKFADNKFTYGYVQSLPIINLDEVVKGFDAHFKTIDTSSIDLNSLEGVATFKHWIEGEFKDWITSSSSGLSNNGFVKHLQTIVDDDAPLLSLDIDVLNPNTDLASIAAYDEILRGVSELEKIPYKNTDFSIADLFLIYNLVVNNNKYGSDRLTTTFKVCTSPNNQLNKYLLYVSDLDYDVQSNMDYDKLDYLISSAPLVTEYSKLFHQERFVKVQDPVRGYNLQILGNDNSYHDYSIVPDAGESESVEEKLLRLKNFAEYSPYEFINSHNQSVKTGILEFDGVYDQMSAEEQETLRKQILKILKDYTTNNKLWIYKDC